MLNALLFALLTAAPAQATAPAIREWTVPWPDTRPRDPAFDADGTVWFVGQVGNYLGRLDPQTGDFRKIDLPKNTLPHNVIVSPSGELWVAGNGNGTILRMVRDTGAVRRTYTMPDPAVNDPHTLAFTGDGTLWFTAQAGNRIGRLDPATHRIDLFAPSVPNARPYGIIGGKNDRPWAVLFGTNRIATFDPKAKRLQEFTLPWQDARPRRLAQSGDGAIWYVDYARGSVGRLDPASGKAREWPAPGGSSGRLYAMALDDKGRVWFVETGRTPNVLAGFDTKTERFLPGVAVPSGGGTVRHMIFDPKAKALWFGTDANTIGRAVLP